MLKGFDQAETPDFPKAKGALRTEMLLAMMVGGACIYVQGRVEEYLMLLKAGE